MWQDLIAGTAVLLAFAWVLWRLVLPAGLRGRLRRLAGVRPRDAAAGACGGCCGCTGTGSPAQHRRHG